MSDASNNAPVYARNIEPRRSFTAAARGGPFIHWQPGLRSVDAEVLHDGPQLKARARDLVRNHPFAAAVVRTAEIGTIGDRLRYSCRPDWRFLGIDEEASILWAEEWERIWESYAHAYDNGVDAARRQSFTQIVRMAARDDMVDGEYVVAAEWDTARRWHTCWQSVDTDRLSQPMSAPETHQFRGGVELDRFGAPVAYHIRNAHPADHGFHAHQALTWTRVPLASSWGRPIMLHGFQAMRPGQTRGVSHFAPVIEAMKMGADYANATLQAMVLQASIAAVVKSEANHKAALEAIGMSQGGVRNIDGDTLLDLAERQLEASHAWHEAVNFEFGGAKATHLFPGESIELLTPGQSGSSLNDFQAFATQAYAAGTGADSIAVSGDYSRVNYSSAKMAAATTYRYFAARRERIVQQLCMPMVAAVFEEAAHAGAVTFPKGLDLADLYHIRDALIRGTFLAQGAPILDPVKEAQALRMRMELGIDSLRDACAAEGKDWRDVMEQRAREKSELMARGLGDPMWLATGMVAPDADAAEPEVETEE